MLVDWMMAVLRFAAVASVCPRVVPREEWGARPPVRVEDMRAPARYVVIHHTYIPPACQAPEECAAAMREMQDMHQIKNGWFDIGYNFAIGGDARVYKGRGWSRVGAHAPPYNNASIGITIIGDWRTEAPPQALLDMAQWLIRCGVDTGRIAHDYQLIGHRQARSTECPGDALYNVIKTWPHWTENPTRPAQGTPDHAERLEPASQTAPSSSSSPSPSGSAPLVPPLVPVATDPASSGPEVRQLSKRSLWDRLVSIVNLEGLDGLGAPR